MEYVVEYYQSLGAGPVILAHDGKTSGPFNRHAAYNRGMAQIEAETYLWNEADSLIPPDQISKAITLAHERPGLVIPFTERHELSPGQTQEVLHNHRDPFSLKGAQDIFPDKSSIGQAGVTSRRTMELIGGRWDESFSGWGFDDNAMHYVFGKLAGSPCWVTGKGIHLYHTPGYSEPSPEQAQATERNHDRFQYLRSLTPDALRQEMLSG